MAPPPGVCAVLAMLAAGCTPDLPRPDPQVHRNRVIGWRESRFDDLKQPDGWFSVVGLYWLEPGVNSFGADSTNDVVFPPPAPPRIGTFVRRGDAVQMKVDPGVPVTLDGLVVDSTDLWAGDGGRAPVAVLGSLRWFVIERQGLVGIRLKDTANAAIAEFTGIESFPISVDWDVPARFDRYDPPKVIEIPTVIGTVSEQQSPGAVKFRVGNRKYRLDVTGPPDAERYFIVFGDLTNGKETYGGGRFLSVAAPDSLGRTFVDFNMAYNPPCVFTAYATCPLPTAQNRLKLRVEAGEKMYHGGAH